MPFQALFEKKYEPFFSLDILTLKFVLLPFLQIDIFKKHLKYLPQKKQISEESESEFMA